MKKLLTCLLVLFLASAMFPADAWALPADARAGQVAVSSGSLNVRSNASTEAAVVGSLAKGSYVTLISKSGNWWRVEYSRGQYGYCHANYIRLLSAKTAEVKTQWGNLNVRSGAGTGHTKTGSLSGGTRVLVLSTSSGWSRILYHGAKTGWVSSQYLVSSEEKYPAVSLSVPSFKQTDSRWSSVKIGNSGKTIGQIGCATTAVAMMQSYRTGYTVYPDAMSKQLSYSAEGNLYWPSDYTVVTNGSGYLNTIYQLLRQGKPVLFGVKNSSGGQHWVVVTGYSGGSSLAASGFVINDPGSSSRTNLQQLLNSYPVFYKFFYY